MSKLKLSFSFVLMLFLVGMFSAAAFAAGSTAPSQYNNGVTVEGDTIQDGLTGTDQGNDNNYDGTTKSNANQTGTGVGGQTANFNQVIKSDDMVKIADGSHGTQRTHGEYMNNTNSCASCHQTHTGAAESLLFKDGRYQTCTACHDGTLGFYNVFTQDDSAGTFGGSHDGNMSAHLANGTVALKAAPGGNKDATEGNWTEEFSCASCHAPHGSYSDRLLNEDPNGMANILIKDGGKKVENVPVINLASFDANTIVPEATVTYQSDDAETAAAVGTKSINFVAVRYNVGDAGAPVNADVAAKGLQNGDVVIQLMKWDYTATTPKYVVDTDPWIHEYEFDTTHTKHYWTAFSDGAATYAPDYGDPEWQNKPKDTFDTDQLKKGEVLGAGFAGVRLDEAKYPGATALTTKVNALTTGKVARGYVVKLDMSAPDGNNVKTSTVSSLWASKNADGTNNAKYIANRGVAMSTFCASCHVDYLAKSGSESGTFDHSYRHTTTSDSYTCVRCHYAHGTDVTVMRDARGKTYDQILADTTNYFPTVVDPTARETVVKDYLTDKNPSSALKRYTNMAVCWACHTSSHSGGTRNTDSYQYNPTPGIDTDRNGIEFDY